MHVDRDVRRSIPQTHADVPELEPHHFEERRQRAHHQPEADDAAA